MTGEQTAKACVPEPEPETEQWGRKRSRIPHGVHADPKRLRGALDAAATVLGKLAAWLQERLAECWSASPGGSQVTDHQPLVHPPALFQERQGRLGIVPACRPDAEPFLLKVGYGGVMIAQLVMPVAEDDVGGNLVDRRRCAVVAGLPLAVTHRSVLEQPVTPHQHRHLLVLDKVRVQVVDRRGKNRRRTLASASRALIAGDQKHLIHADVKGVGFERISQLIDQGKHDAVDLRIQRAPAPAVNPLVVGGDFGRLVELRVLLEQRRPWSSPTTDDPGS